MPRPPLDPNSSSEVQSVRLPAALMDRVRTMARESDRTIGGQLRHLVRRGVDEDQR